MGIPLLRQSAAWLNSENAAGLHALSAVQRITEAEVFADKRKGGLTDYFQSSDSFEAGAQVESFFRVSSKTVYYGKIDYRNFTGKDMGGSFFIDPRDTPFDIVEQSDENRGTKKRECTHLTGAVATDLSDKFSLGGKVDYTAAIYAKQKDLRHVNKLMDLYATAGASYRLNRKLELGVNYYYRRSAEGLLVDMYGTTGKVYNSLISYGAFLGTQEQFGENGYTKENEEKPLFNEYHGAALQVEWTTPCGFSLFNELGYKSRNGYYGRKSPTTVVFSEHEGKLLSYNGRLSLHRQRNLHTLDAGFQWETLDNYENIYRYDNEGGGKTNVGYYGQLHTTERSVRSLNVDYTANFGIAEGCPEWTVQCGFDYFSRTLTASVYPYYRDQDVHAATFRLSGERNLRSGQDLYTLHIGAGYSTGGGYAAQDGLYAAPSESQTAPAGNPLFLNREFEYLTGQQLRAEATAKYARPVGNTGLKAFVALRYRLNRALQEVQYLQGNTLHEVGCSVGCTF
jgi:hypothetical protein